MHLRSILEQNQTKNDQNSSDDIKYVRFLFISYKFAFKHSYCSWQLRATGNKRPRSEESPPVTTPKVFSPSLASKPVLPNPFLIPTDESFSQTQSNVQHDLVRKIPAFSIAENVVNLDKNPWQQKWEEERNHRIQVEFQVSFCIFVVMKLVYRN